MMKTKKTNNIRSKGDWDEILAHKLELDKERKKFHKGFPIANKRRIPGVKDEAIAKALMSSLGQISQAAIILNLSPIYLRKRIRENEDLTNLRGEIKEFRLDLAESKLNDKVLEGKWPAVQFLLESQGKGRGYTKRTELSGPEGNSLVFEFSDGVKHDE